MSVLRDRRLAPHRDRLVLGRIRHPEVLVDPDLTGQVQRVADPNTIAEGERSGLRGAPWRHVQARRPRRSGRLATDQQQQAQGPRCSNVAS
jgi:hypothetical protein